jgi:hypothetical protein
MVGACGAAPREAPGQAPLVVIETSVGDTQQQPGPIATETWDPTKAVQAGQVWRGRYQCAQGWTQAVLRIVTVDHQRVAAIFEFFHRESGARGAYHVQGIYAPETLRLSLVPGAWIDQPQGYISVALGGALRSEGETYEGQIAHQSCGAFRLRRSDLD